MMDKVSLHGWSTSGSLESGRHLAAGVLSHVEKFFQGETLFWVDYTAETWGGVGHHYWSWRFCFTWNSPQIMLFPIFLRPIFAFPGCFSIPPAEAANTCHWFLLSQTVFHLFWLIFPFPDEKLLFLWLWFCGYVSGFPVPSCASRMPAALLRDAPGLQAGSAQACRHFCCQHFSRHFPSVFFPL